MIATKGSPPQRALLKATDPRNNNEFFSWVAEIEWPTQDIMVCKNALPFLPDLVKAAESWGDWKPCTIVKGENTYTDKGHRDSEHLAITGAVVKGVHREVYVYGLMLHSVEARFLEMYRSQNPFAEISESSGYDLLRYREGQFFNEHIDVILGGGVLSQRALSAIAFCDDGYKGGDLVFPRQGLRFKPEPGTLILFPSGITHPHAVEPVTEGVRHSVVCWYY